MERTSQLLSALSNNVGIVSRRLWRVIACSTSNLSIFPTIGSWSFCFVANIVHNKIIRLNVTFSKSELDRTANYLNAEFAGKSLAEIRAKILRLMHEERRFLTNPPDGSYPLFAKHRGRGRPDRRSVRGRYIEYFVETGFLQTSNACVNFLGPSEKNRV